MRGLTLGDPALLGAAAGFSPLSLSPALWLDASDAATITSSGGLVSSWADKSGNGRNVTQGTTTAQPGTGAITQNGLNVLTFDGGDRLAAATAADWKFLHDGTDWIAACVMQAGTAANPNTAYTVIATNSPFGQPQVGVAWWYDDRSSQSRNDAPLLFVSNGTATYQHTNFGSNAWTPNQFAVVSLRADLDNATAANRSSLFVNAGSAIANNTATGTPSAANPTTPINVGGAPGGFNLVGRIAELVIVSGANATEANRVALRDYLNTKWAVY